MNIKLDYKKMLGYRVVNADNKNVGAFGAQGAKIGEKGAVVGVKS